MLIRIPNFISIIEKLKKGQAQREVTP
jgi:hypothetical protein